MLNIKIITENKEELPFIVIYKPSGLPSAPLSKDDKNNALSMAMDLYPEIKNVKGKKEIEYGLLHRIDTMTKGLLLIALTQSFYDYMTEEQKEGRFIKYYRAECTKIDELLPGFSECPVKYSPSIKEYDLSSYFRYYGPGNKEVRPVHEDSNTFALKKIGKKVTYKTHVEIENISGDNVSVLCKISSGFKHQVRSHLCWLGLRIKGDNIYNPGSNEDFMFEACGFEFEYKGKMYFFGKK